MVVVLFTQEFTSTSSIQVSHNLNRLNVGVRAIIGAQDRTDLITQVIADSNQPQNIVTVYLSGVYSGFIQVLEAEFLSSLDFIQVNSGTCTGKFSVNTISTNTLAISGPTTADHLVANSGTLAGKLTSNSAEINNGVFLSSLTVSGLPVRIDSVGMGSGITAVVQDPSPTLGGNLNGNSKDITALNSITANTANFPVSVSAGTLSNNSTSTALTTTTNHLVANSGTLSAKLIAGTTQANTGTFSTSLTISGVPVPTLNAHRTYYFISGAATASTNATAAPQFYNNTAGFVQRVDFSGCREVRFEGTQVAVGSSATCRISCDGRVGSYSTTRTDYTTIATAGVNGNLSLDANTANAYKDTGWLPLLPSFQTDCFLAVVISGGNGAADPSFSQLKVSAR